MTETLDRDLKPRRKSPIVWLMQRRFRLVRSLTLGGQACVIDDAGHVLLVRHGYRPGWHFPGGGVEIGESVVDAALRELLEETGIAALGTPYLHGIFNHAANFRGDHIVVYIVREFERRLQPAANFEIAEQGFFSPSNLPKGTNFGTQRRIAEIFDGHPLSPVW